MGINNEYKCTCVTRVMCRHCKQRWETQEDQRSETIGGVTIYAWSRRDPRAAKSPRGFRDNEFHLVIRDQATIYEAHGPEPITEITRDEFVGLVAIIRHCRSASMDWPFYGRGITGAGPSPWDLDEGWLVPSMIQRICHD